MVDIVRKQAGRPRFFASEENRKLVLDVLATGGSRNDAAKMAGTTRQTIGNEVRANPEFAAAIDAAEVHGKVSLIERVFNASEDDWKAAAWMLERKYPKEFGKRAPDAISSEELASIVGRVVAVLLSGVPKRYHVKVQADIDGLLASLSSYRADREEQGG